MTRAYVLILVASTIVVCSTVGAADRINQEGRILGTLPTVSSQTLFNTSAADAVVSAMQIFPVTNAWNEDVSRLPLLGGGSDPTQSNAMIAQIRSDVSVADRQRVVVFQEMNYVLIPDSQMDIGIYFAVYAGDSDLNGGTSPYGSWPIPTMMPIEGWPSQTGSYTLSQVQTIAGSTGSDRHSIIVQPGIGQTFETWQALLTTNNPAWQASNGCIFDLNSNALRPAGETSGDAAGLSMFPALVRYDEAERGMVEHAMRIVVKTSRQSYIYPATHQAGSTTNTVEPAMGQRLRLKSSFVIPGTWTKEETAIALALKKYGGLVADNGNFFSMSICPDDRWPAHCFDHLSTGAGSDFCDITNFEVVDSTGPTGGPRSAGAPTANAGANQSVALSAGAALVGTVTGTGVTTLWSLYTTPTPPGTVTFSDATSASTTATFSAVGTYILMLTASDGIHSPAFSSTYITVGAGSNPAPTISSISPTTAIQYSGAVTLTVTGTGFVPDSQVTWSGHANLPAVTATATQLTVVVPDGDIAAVGTVQVGVYSPPSGGGSSTTLPFMVTADVTPPLISALSISGITATTATVTWTTNELATSQVLYGLSTSYGSNSVLATTPVTAHAVTLTGLSPSTAYHLQASSNDQAGNNTVSSDATFTTTAASGTGSFPTSGSSGGHSCGLGVVAALLSVLALGVPRWLSGARSLHNRRFRPSR